MEGKNLHFDHSGDAEGVIEGVKLLGEIVNPVRHKELGLYLGSVDMLLAQTWAKECGAPIGTKEFTAYAKKKLTSGEFARLQAPKQKLLF